MGDREASYDLVILGATGFVGHILCKYLVGQVGVNGSVRWAIAGRSETKLKALVSELERHEKEIPYLIADVMDEVSVKALCEQTRIVISTVGPYALYGETLVKVCAEMGVDYCDLTGEPQWVRQMIERYHATAQRSGARIIHCCGFDSVPSDLGVYYLQQQAQQKFGQYCNRVKMRVKSAQGGISGGTAASGVNILKETRINPELRQELSNPYSLCPETPQSHPPTLVPVQYDADYRGWVSPFVMAGINTRIVLRSNALLNYPYGKKFQYEEATLTGEGWTGWLAAQGLSLFLSALATAITISPLRWVLMKTIIPQPGQGPSPISQSEGFYELRFWGETDDGKTLEVKVIGDQDPGYGSTSQILGQVGLCLAKDVSKSDKPGGFWTPATMFGDTLIKRLEMDAGLTFKVCKVLG